MHIRMCTIIRATSNHRPHLISFRNRPANGKIHFQTRRSHKTQSAVWVPIGLVNMLGHSSKCSLPFPCCPTLWSVSIPWPLFLMYGECHLISTIAPMHGVLSCLEAINKEHWHSTEDAQPQPSPNPDKHWWALHWVTTLVLLLYPTHLTLH
jgi:hypothetical protein